jgi:phosphohistidine phosphatase
VPRELWLLRHGEAAPAGPGQDDQRPLTARGEGQALAAGRALAALGVTFAHVFSSPRVRARETARRVCAPLALDPVEHAPLRGGLEADEAVALAAAAGADGRVLLVGHNPDLAQIVYDLTGARVRFDPGSLAAIALDDARSHLLALLAARELAAIGN